MPTIDELLDRLPDGYWVTFYKLTTGRWAVGIVQHAHADDTASEAIDDDAARAFERALEQLSGSGN